MTTDSTRPPPDLDRVGRWSLLAIVSTAVAATVVMNDAPATSPENLGILGLAAVFLALLIVVGERLAGFGAVARAAYFGLQLTLTASIFSLQATIGSFGMAWLLLMPLLVQGTFVCGRAGTALVGAATVLLPALHVTGLAGWQAGVEVAIGIGAASLFVVLFSASTVRERRAREESERLAGELFATNQRLTEMAAEAEELAVMRERNRLAREIHDSVGHGLTVGHVQIQAARVHLGRSPDLAEPALEAAATAVRQGLEELRRSVATLRSPPLTGDRLIDALERLCRGAEADGRTVTLEVRGRARVLEPEVAHTLYRIAQEGLTNVHRHSDGRNVEILLEYRRDGASLSLTDDGSGVGPPPGSGFGLLGLRERLALHGGALDAVRPPEGGFRLHAEIG